MAGLSDLEESIKVQEEEAAKQRAKVDEQERMALELANAQKEQMIALAQERRARVVADLSLSQERASEAEENRAQAALARAKTITEIATMQDERILQVLEFVNMLEQQEAQDRQNIDQTIHAQSDQINTETQGSAENMQQQAMLQMQQSEQQNMNELSQGG
jgi:glutamine synthetase type III